MWCETWEVESWREGRHYFEKKDTSLRDIAESIAAMAYQMQPADPQILPLKGRISRTHQEAGIGISQHGLGWIVALMRQGRNIRRRFADSRCGGQDKALLLAQGYRDAVIQMFPDAYSRNKMLAKNRNNTSGVTGVHEVIRQSKSTGWRAQINSKRLGIRKAFFSSEEYGDEKAMTLAIESREKWLAEILADDQKSGGSVFMNDDEFRQKLDLLNQDYTNKVL